MRTCVLVLLLLLGTALVACDGVEPDVPPTPIVILPSITVVSDLPTTATTPVLPAATATLADGQAAPATTATALPTLEAAASAVPAETPVTPPVAQGVDERLQFAPGAISASVQQAVVRGTQDRYLLQAQEGQILQINLTSVENNAVANVYEPAGSLLAGEVSGSWQGRLPMSGDYAIVIGPTRGNATYRLDVTIPPEVSASPSRIEFEPGMTSKTIEGQLPAGATHQYVLRAVEDQWLNADLYTESGAAVLAVSDERGRQYLSSAAGQSSLSLPALPATQDYIISVIATGGATDYQLSVGVSPLDSLPARVEFSPGSNSATINGSLVLGGDLDSYLIGAAAGQEVTIEFTPAGPLSVYLRGTEDDSFFAAENGRLQATLPAAQDYLLTVSSPNAAGEISYSMSITIE